MPSEQTPLLEPQDHDDSRVAETRVKATTPLPKLQIFCVYYTQFCEPLTTTVITPFVVQLVRGTGITGGNEAKTGYYAGCIESVFYASETLTVVLWGRLSDRIGRRPPLVWGILGTAAAILSFGLSKTFWMLVMSRSIQGIFNGNIGLAKSVVAEVTDSTNIARALSFQPLIWGIGGAFGPVIGGVFADPAHSWPGSLGKMQFLRENPYFLPCFVAALVPCSAFLFNLIFLKESSQVALSHKTEQHEEETPTREYPENSPQNDCGGSEQHPSSFRSLLTRDVAVTLINYAFLAFIKQSFLALMPLIFASPVEYGGIGFDSLTIGIVMSSQGIASACLSILLLPVLSRKLGFRKFHRLMFAFSLIVLLAFSLMNLLARRRLYGAVYAAVACYISSYVLLSLCFGSMFVFINNSAPSPSTLGSINGLAQMVASVTYIFAALSASWLFSATHQYNLLGGTLVFWVLFVVILGGIYASSKLPKQLKMDK